jgi:cytochrome oxidase Cu insertion factor (SCO1/SenC/PrrC family)
MPSKKSLKKYIALGGILFLFPLTFILVFAKGMDHRFGSLPYFSAEFPTGTPDQIEYKVPEFSFINQEGTVYTRDSLKGKIWIAACFSSGRFLSLGDYLAVKICFVEVSK